MTFNRNADVGGSSARKRGRGPALAGGAGALGVVVLLISVFTGNDFSGLLGGGGQAAPQSSEIVGCETGADANEDDECRLAAGQLAIDGYWERQIEGYRAPQLIIVDGATPTSCGEASNATGPFYCPPEEHVYVDETFWSILRQQFGAEVGPLAQLYVLAHEYGHHVQQITGVMERYPRSESGADSNAVRIELQADCFAGAWVADAATVEDENGVAFLREPTKQEVDDALEAAAAVGDDHIQAQSGQVNPETWTHGSSEQRQRWFTVGYEGGPGACDTFAPADGEL